MRRIGAALLALGAALAVVPAAAAAAPTLTWKPCGEAECATLSVPLDWDKPGERVAISVSRAPARDQSRRIGALMFSPGGPGSGTAELVARYAKEVFPDEVRDRFDLIGLDFRGTGTSTPIRCDLPPHDPSSDRFPVTAAATAKLAGENAAFANSCAAKTGPVMAHLDTDTIARDMDALREALGEKQISYLGLSYGSMLGQAYAERFPHRLRALALDGVVDRSLPTRQLVKDNAVSTQDGWTQFVDWCARDASCALHGKDPRQVLRDVTALAERGALKAGDRVVTPREVQAGALLALNANTFLPAMASGLVKALTGDGSMLTQGMINSPMYTSYRSIICQDIPVGFPLHEAVGEVRALNPDLGGYSELWDIASGCAGWPQPVRWTPHTWRGTPPSTLLVSGAHDVATPRTWAESVHRQIPGSHLLTWPGVGHTAWMGNNKCAREATARYLLTLEMPSSSC
ncbi:alpha/beta hydrolase [Allokutzneria oryzae]|uniref:Alpha/beta hydrolase n=1 Tax=Allokutzneria oryzae TaxID=1378989 RepID=A0ABV5ZUC9_9PSEU